REISATAAAGRSQGTVGVDSVVLVARDHSRDQLLQDLTVGRSLFEHPSKQVVHLCVFCSVSGVSSDSGFSPSRYVSQNRLSDSESVTRRPYVDTMGGLWDKPIPVPDEMPSTPFIYSDIVCAETLHGYNIEAYQSHEESIYFKNLESDPEYNLRNAACNVIKEICPMEQPEIRCSGGSKDTRYALSTQSDQCEKYNTRSEKILCGVTSKA
ncbi:hypothetical protein KI387_021594, partial [Taxus chinensis]